MRKALLVVVMVLGMISASLAADKTDWGKWPDYPLVASFIGEVDIQHPVLPKDLEKCLVLIPMNGRFSITDSSPSGEVDYYKDSEKTKKFQESLTDCMEVPFCSVYGLPVGVGIVHENAGGVFFALSDIKDIAENIIMGRMQAYDCTTGRSAILISTRSKDKFFKEGLLALACIFDCYFIDNEVPEGLIYPKYPEYAHNLGKPLDSYKSDGGLYWRDFQKGKAAFNASMQTRRFEGVQVDWFQGDVIYNK